MAGWSSAARLLRARLERSGPLLVAGAHNPLSARLVEEADFDAVWASGFEISASQCVPDANILTFSENLAIARNIAMAVHIPVIADCDSGYGNSVNVIRTVREYEAAGVAGICLEDNVFPKRCSFYASSRRELAPIEEHVGKIRAAKTAQRDPDTFIIARTEALIAGWGREEALQRARAYADAGADAVMIHSKSRTFDESREAAALWDRDCPLVVVPTIFNQVTADECAEAGFKIVIYANHGLRAGIHAMQRTLAKLRRCQRPADVEPDLVPLTEVYRLVGVEQMNAQEAEFLPSTPDEVTAVIIAAGFEPEMLPLTADRPKCMLDVHGRSILERQVATLNQCGIKNIAVVRGYQKDAVNVSGLRYYDNDDYERTSELASLLAAEPELRGRVLALYGDVLFDHSIVRSLLASDGDVAIAVDRAWYDAWQISGRPQRSLEDLVQTAHRPDGGYRYLPSQVGSAVEKIGRDLDRDACDGEFIGLTMFSPAGIEQLKTACARRRDAAPADPLHEAPSLDRAKLTDILQHLIDLGHRVTAVDTYKGWMEVDSPEDYRLMCEKLSAEQMAAKAV